MKSHNKISLYHKIKYRQDQFVKILNLDIKTYDGSPIESEVKLGRWNIK